MKLGKSATRNALIGIFCSVSLFLLLYFVLVGFGMVESTWYSPRRISLFLIFLVPVMAYLLLELIFGMIRGYEVELEEDCVTYFDFLVLKRTVTFSELDATSDKIEFTPDGKNEYKVAIKSRKFYAIFLSDEDAEQLKQRPEIHFKSI